MKKPQLVLLHFAGGNCYSFQFLTPLLRDFDIITVELPGRGKRIGQPLLRNFNEAAEDVYQQLLPRVNDGRYVVYGHSMGAYLALRVSNMLEKAGLRPTCLLVSGNAGPGIYDNKKRYALPHDAFVAELLRLGGVPQELIESEELFALFEPVLRADFEISEEHNMSDEPPVHAPLFAMMGDREEKAGDIANWGRFTRGNFGYEILEGDHFFIHKHPRKLAALIREHYAKYDALSPARPFLPR